MLTVIGLLIGWLIGTYVIFSGGSDNDLTENVSVAQRALYELRSNRV